MITVSGLGVGMVLLGVFLLEWFYPVVCALYRSATPGKRSLGLAVVRDDGTPVRAAASLVPDPIPSRLPIALVKHYFVVKRAGAL